jgi:hypothetical protein
MGHRARQLGAYAAGFSRVAITSVIRPIPRWIESAINKAERIVTILGSLNCPAKRFARSRSSSSVC